MEFTDSQWSTIAHALDVAARQYRKNAEEMRKFGKEAFGEAAHERLAQQFDRQVVEAFALANTIREERGV
jgi:hypothetical protein